MIRLTLLALLIAGPAWAQDFPALYDVVDVAADDVLNVRERPDATAPILGTLAPDATGIEVVATMGDWARIGRSEAAGYVALRFLARQEGPSWTTLTTPLTCFGTEPFWSLLVDPASGTTAFSTPEAPAPLVRDIDLTWPGELWAPVAAISTASDMAVFRAAECSDGMSDRAYGIAVDLFLRDAERPRLSGCCTLGAVE